MHSRYASQSHHGVEYDLQLLALSYPPFEHKLCLLVYQRERQISFFGFLGNLVLMFTSIRLKMSFLNHIIIPFSLFSFLWSYTHTQYSITYTQGCKPVWLGLSVEQWGQCLNSKATRCIWLVLAQVISRFRNFVLATDSRKEMESWIQSIVHASQQKYYDVSDNKPAKAHIRALWYSSYSLVIL